MRIIELLLLLLSLLILLQFFTLFRGGEGLGRWLVLTGGILFVLHLGLEGVRWQMVGAYLVILAYGLGVLFRVPVDLGSAKWFLFALASLLTLLSLGLAHFLPVFSLPTPQGPYNLVAEDRSTSDELAYRI